MKTSEFQKTGSCPTSDELLAFSSSELCDESSGAVEDHVASCEFCSMELEMYNRFPQSNEEVETPVIPRALYELAKMLLPKGGGEHGFNSVFGDDGDLELGQPCGAF